MNERKGKNLLPRNKTKGRMTIRDIAKLAGVSQPVISAVLNNNYKSVKVAKLLAKGSRTLSKNMAIIAMPLLRHFRLEKQDISGFFFLM